MKINKLQNYLKTALATAENSHDAERKVGALLINKDTGVPLSSGYNSFIRGAYDDILPRTRPEKYNHILHAEQKLLSNCLRNNIDVRNCEVLVTLSPCKICLTALWEAGIDTIYFPKDEIHSSFKETLKIKDINIGLGTVGLFSKITLSAKMEN